MRPQLQKLPLNQGSSFVLLDYQRPYNETPWHYHPEYEIVLVLESEGTRFVGDKVDTFKAGDLSFIGPNVPHYYRNTDAYYQDNPAFKTRNIVIHFLENFLGDTFFEVPEMLLVRQLFEKSKRGLDMEGNTKKVVSQLLLEMIRQSPAKRLISLLEILELLSNSSETKFISNYNMVGTNPSDAEKINVIFNYVLKHFKEEIKVADIAEKVHLSETGFSRYFKHRTRKTFSEFVQEIRLGEAKRLLIETEKNIAEIAFECGFNNLSNFNRQFKHLTNVSPSSYKYMFKNQ
ncbi:MAG: AraC family transcriptional regulator [Bacteroidota bacterium]|nr:AraC family transcriptional regulator [Bacteroidota bacterium]